MGLYSHLRDLNALEDGIPYGKYVFVPAIIIIMYSIRACTDAAGLHHYSFLQVVWSLLCE